MVYNSMVQPSVEQQEHDRRAAQQSPQERQAMYKGLAELARSRLLSSPSSSSPETPASSPSSEPPQPA